MKRLREYANAVSLVQSLARSLAMLDNVKASDAKKVKLSSHSS